MEPPVYLDYNATTPIDQRVLDAMLPYLTEAYGNASSGHALGYRSRQAVEDARDQVAALLSAAPHTVAFTNGASETINLAIKGTVFRRLADSPHVVAGAADHPATVNTLTYLRGRFGVEFTLVPVDEFGMTDPDDVRAALRPNTVLVTVMHANNEVGTIQPVAEIARLSREAGVLFHVDGAQAAGKIPVNVETLGADLLTIAGHKLYAPKGIAALFIRPGTAIDSLIHGSAQEHGVRAGTENVASIVALGAACRLARHDLADESERVRALRDRLHDHLAAEIPGLALNGHPVHRLPNTLNLSFPGVSGQTLLACAPGVAASTASACHSGADAPSPVLLAMGLPLDRAAGAVRFSVGRMTTQEEIDQAGDELVAAYRALVPATLAL